VVVTDARPSTAARLGVDDAALHAANPAIVHCHIGTWAGAGDDDEPVYEGQLAAAIGQMSGRNLLSGKIVDARRADPTFVVPPVNSYGAAMLAVQGILAALTDRERRDPASAGDCLSTSLLHGAMAFLMREDLANPVAEATSPADDVMHRGIELCFLTAECADGRYVQMCARQDHHFRAWLGALGLEHVFDDPRFAGAPLRIATLADVDDLEQMLRDAMRTRTQAEWMQVFTTEIDLGADPFLTPEEFLRHPQMTENGRVVTLADPVMGPTTEVGGLVAIDGATPTDLAPAPVLDADATSIRAALVGTQRRHPGSSSGTTTGGPARPLDGVTILEIAYFVAGPLATTLMAELGARVIKVEPIDGDPYRRTGLQAAKFLAGKQSIALDLKHPDGRRVLHQLIARSDALVHGFRAGVPERLGMDETTARSLRPDIVYLNAASYGSKGPESGRIAFHSTPTALSGAGIAQAGRGNKPVDDSFPDPAAGLGAATALALGLFAQRRTGAGCSLETTMLTSTGYVMSNDTVVADGSAHAAVADSEQLGLSALYRLYECADGWIFLAAVGEGAAQLVATALDLGEIDGADDRRVRAIGGALSTCTVDAALDRFTAVGVAASRVSMRTVDHWLESHGLLQPAEHPDFEPHYQLPEKVRFDHRPAGSRPICSIGEHTVDVLAELGYTTDEIAALIESGAVGSARAVQAPVPVRGGDL
jgi:crotonobetainyl-CoA:carnitine CoA-transferase CaiB-like acyl-CoA transferase